MISATFTRTKPIIPVKELSLIRIPQRHTNWATTGFYPLVQTASAFSSLIQGLEELVTLTSDIRACRGVLPSHDELFSFTARRSWIEWSLSASDSTGIQDCVRFAAMIYINIVLRKMPCASVVLSHLTSELRIALNETDFESTWENKTELLLWVLFQGGAAATEHEMRKWYLARMVRVCSVLGYQTWSEVFEMLDGFLWARCDLIKRCKPLWLEIAVGLSNFDGNK